MRLRLVQCQPVHQPLQLAQGDPLGRRLPAGRPLNGAPFQPAVVEPKARLIPFQNFELGAVPIAEDKQRRRTGIELKGQLHQRGQGVDGLSHIGDAPGQIDRSSSSTWRQRLHHTL